MMVEKSDDLNPVVDAVLKKSENVSEDLIYSINLNGS